MVTEALTQRICGCEATVRFRTALRDAIFRGGDDHEIVRVASAV
jgi:hypothetical protein